MPLSSHCIGGNVSQHFQCWQEHFSNPVLLDWIQNGIKLPFTTTPNPINNTNRHFTLEETVFVRKEIKSLLKNKCIIKCDHVPHCVSGLSVVPKKSYNEGSDKFRLILDLREVNKYCEVPKFNYSDINSVIEIIEPKDQLVTLDIKSGFHHLKIHKDFSDFLGFYFEGVFYKFIVLVFGLNSSPYFFHKTLRPLVEHLADKDIKCVIYVDDFLLCAKEDKICEHRDYLLHLLQQLGWTINYDKSSLTPDFKKQYIGFIIDTFKKENAIWIEIPKCRIKTVKHDIARALKKGSITARGLARITGQIVAMSKAIIPAKLLLRNCYRLLKTRKNWSDTLLLNDASHKDLVWWFHSLKQWNGKCVSTSIHQEAKQIATDASSLGYGGLILGTEIQAQGYWNKNMASQSSNMREITAVLRCLLSFKNVLQNKRVSILTDNVTTAAYINFQGGPCADLSKVATEIWGLSVRYNMTITAKWLAGKLNTIPDFLSRYSSKYNWKLHPALFRYLDKVWGPHNMDRFACMASTMCPLYNSLYLDPKTSGVDALSQNDWAQYNNYVNAPFRLIPKILNILDHYQATATIIAPKFKAHSFYKKLIKRSIAHPIRLPQLRKVCVPLCPVLPEPLRNPRWALYAWRICGRRSF